MRIAMDRIASLALAFFLLTGGKNFPVAQSPPQAHRTSAAPHRARTYLGFDRNDYPGDSALASLRRAFAFCGYWLNAPPGETANTWRGKRGILRAHGFGFLVLFNGRLDKDLQAARHAKRLGARDAAAAVQAAHAEGFSPATIIFIDQEEGGRMLPEQIAYLDSWIDAVNASGYRAGIYCSGIPAEESAGNKIITANDIHSRARGRKIKFFIYNDACPPSPGCAFPPQPPPPQQSGIPFATAWQFAQSPQRIALTASCPRKYNPDGNCYAPSPAGNRKIFVDVDSATSPDPSAAR
jgi:hypothetical protein